MRHRLFVLLMYILQTILFALFISLLLMRPGKAHAQLPVIDAAVLTQSTVSALNSVEMVANQLLDLLGLALQIDDTYSDDLDAIGDVLADARALSFDAKQLNIEITQLLGLNSAPRSSAELRGRLADIRQMINKVHLYAIRTQNLLTTLQNTMTHMRNLIGDLEVLIGNLQGHMLISQYQAEIAKNLATLQTQTVAWQRADTLEKLEEQLVMESLEGISDEIMQDWPR
jgi:hypothetical protein